MCEEIRPNDKFMALKIARNNKKIPKMLPHRAKQRKMAEMKQETVEKYNTNAE